VHIAEANGLARFVGFEFGLTGSGLDESRIFDQDGKDGKDDW